jgi:hypothetical protein
MALKRPETVFKSFTHALVDVDLTFFCSRLHRQYQGDTPEALNYLDKLTDTDGQVNPVTNLLSGAKDYLEFDKFLDMFFYSCVKEYEKRGYRLEQLI